MVAKVLTIFGLCGFASNYKLSEMIGTGKRANEKMKQSTTKRKC